MTELRPNSEIIENFEKSFGRKIFEKILKISNNPGIKSESSHLEYLWRKSEQYDCQLNWNWRDLNSLLVFRPVEISPIYHINDSIMRALVIHIGIFIKNQQFKIKR